MGRKNKNNKNNNNRKKQKTNDWNKKSSRDEYISEFSNAVFQLYYKVSPLLPPIRRNNSCSPISPRTQPSSTHSGPPSHSHSQSPSGSTPPSTTTSSSSRISSQVNSSKSWFRILHQISYSPSLGTQTIWCTNLNSQRRNCASQNNSISFTPISKSAIIPACSLGRN